MFRCEIDGWPQIEEFMNASNEGNSEGQHELKDLCRAHGNNIHLI